MSLLLIDKYVSLLPEIGKNKKQNFYLQALDKHTPAQWYTDQPVRRNTLTKVVKTCLKAVTETVTSQTIAYAVFVQHIFSKLVSIQRS